MSTGRAIPTSSNAARILYDRDGDGELEEVFFNYLYHPMTDRTGAITGVIAVAVEVTEEVRARTDAEEARREAEEARRQAEGASRAKSDFLTTMSHELRTPLNAIAGYVQLIEMGVHGPVTDAQLGALERVRRSQQHLLYLINEVLNLARIETGRVEYTLASLPLVEVVGDVVAMVEPLFAEKELDFETEIPPDPTGQPPRVVADRDKLQQIVLNLLSNAIKFTPAGGRIRIEAARLPDDPSVVAVSVSDSGIGIPPARLESIFEPFVQLASRNSGDAQSGVGLGLAISRDLARGMDGDLVVSSTVGRGSTFTLTLPAGPAD